MGRFCIQIAIAIITGVIGAGVLHIIIILSLPSFSARDAYSRVLRLGELHEFHALPGTAGKEGLANTDPFVKTAVCAFDLSDNPLRIMGLNPGVPFWSLGVFDPSSNEVFSINDRTAVAGAVDVILATPSQMNALRTAAPVGGPQTGTQSIMAEISGTSGYAVLRSLAPHLSLGDLTAKFIAGATCAPLS